MCVPPAPTNRADTHITTEFVHPFRPMDRDPASLTAELPSLYRPALQELEVRVAETRRRKKIDGLLWRGRSGMVFSPEGLDGYVAKRLTPFTTDERRELYARSVDAYARLLRDPIGLSVEPHQCEPIDGKDGPVLYILQRRLPEATIGTHRIAAGDADEVQRTLNLVLRNALRVWHRNEVEREIHTYDSQIGLDLRLSNWSIIESAEGFEAVYFDTGTPFIRRLGRDRVDPEMFPQQIPSAPGSFWSRRRPEEELNRFYDFGLALTDLLAELAVVAPDHFDAAVDRTNEFLAGEAADLGESAIDKADVRKAMKLEKKRREAALPKP